MSDFIFQRSVQISKQNFEESCVNLETGIEVARRQRLVELARFYGVGRVMQDVIDELRMVEEGRLDLGARRLSNPNAAGARNAVLATESDQALQDTTGGALGLDGVEIPVRDGGVLSGVGPTTMSEMVKDTRARLVLENPKWKGSLSEFDE
jgi:hypothetical protein